MKKLYFVGLLAGSLALTTACVDDNYDLDDIDTTSAIKLNNLVVPVNLDVITLDEVLDIEEDDLIQIFTDQNGNSFYAIRKEGEFNAQTFEISPLKSTNGATINPIEIPSLQIGAGSASVNLPTYSVGYYYHLSDVDQAVTEVTKLTMSNDDPMLLDLVFTSSNLPSFDIEGLVIEIPETFTAFYNNTWYENGGLIALGNLHGGVLESPIEIYALKLDAERHADDTMEFKGELSIVEGTVKVNSSSAQTFDLKIQFSMSPFTAQSISGIINYEIEAPELQPVDLGDIPDFLSDSGTNLVLENPQIYLSISNPTTAEVMGELYFKSERHTSYTELSTSIDFINNLFLAPSSTPMSLDIFSSKNYQTNYFDDLKYILAGDGIPSKIQMQFNNARVAGELINFDLTKSYELAGSYTFFTPLALGNGSRIIYTDKEEDFFGDDMKDVKVSHLQITTYPETNLPFAVTLSISPLDKNGNVIMKNGQPITASGSVDANADGSKPLDLNFSQEFTGLDGVTFTVTVDNMSGKSLSPDQFVRLNNIRAKVTGEYITDF